jgi:PAS domain S-box-containing protein
MEDGTKRLLLVEDEALIALTERKQLEKYGYSVAQAMSGEDAVKVALAADAAFDAILMDIDLGRGLDGTQAAAAILEARDIPIVFVSSHTEPEVVAKTESITSFGYVVKNSGIVILDASIKMALKLFRERTERQQAERQLLRLNVLYETLSRINEAIVHAESLESLAAEVSRVAVASGYFALAWIGRHDTATKDVIPIAHAGQPESIVVRMRHSSDPEAEHPCLCGCAIREGRPCLVNDLEASEADDAFRAELGASGIKAAATFPIQVRGSAWGVLGVYASETGVFHDQEIALLEEAALDIGYAMEGLETEALRLENGKFQELSLEVLGVLNQPITLDDSSRSILGLIKERFGYDAVGIRLKDELDFPYFSEMGFDAGFLRAENSLLLRDEAGKVCREADGSLCLECTCGLVLSGKCGPPSRNVTPAGSLWTNDSLATLESMHGHDPRTRPRDRCCHEGYLSVALIPIRAGGETIGLLHLNDRRKGRFTPEAITFFEGLTVSFGIAVMRKRSENLLRESEKRYRLIAENAADVVWVLDPFERRFTFVSPAVERLRGFTPEEVLARPASEALTADSYSLVARSLEADLPAFLSGNEASAVYVNEVDQPRKDGSVVHTEVTARFVRDPEGKVEIVGVTRDMTRRRPA